MLSRLILIFSVLAVAGCGKVKTGTDKDVILPAANLKVVRDKDAKDVNEVKYAQSVDPHTQVTKDFKILNEFQTMVIGQTGMASENCEKEGQATYKFTWIKPGGYVEIKIGQQFTPGMQEWVRATIENPGACQKLEMKFQVVLVD